MGKICSGFGQRDAPDNIMPKLMDAIEYAISVGCDTFFLGNMGRFDYMMNSATKNLKKTYPNIKRICVIPYITKSTQIYKDDLYREYDDLLLPYELLVVPPRYAILKKNEWVIDQSDIVITYSPLSFGGSRKAADYAKQKKKHIINLE